MDNITGVIVLIVILVIILFVLIISKHPSHTHAEGEIHVHPPQQLHTHTSGVYDTVWEPVSGFGDLAGSQNAKLIYNQVGTVVTCSGWFDVPSTSEGVNIAKIRLPITRATPFPNNYGCTGVALSTDNRKNTGYMTSATGTTDAAELHINIESAGLATLVCNFQYSLV